MERREQSESGTEEKASAFHKVMQLIAQSGVACRIHEHEPVCTVAEAEARVPHLTRNLVKTIVFKIKQGHWILAAVDKSAHIDYKRLAAALGVKRTDLRSVAPERVSHELGFQVGGIGPFPIREDIQVIVDQGLTGTILCGAGLNTRTVEIDIQALIRLAGALTAPIAKEAPAASQEPDRPQLPS